MHHAIDQARKVNSAEIAAAMTQALEDAAAREANAPCVLVSMNIELLASPLAGQAQVRVERKTRTLVFLNAAYIGADGVHIASASSVHRVVD